MEIINLDEYDLSYDIQYINLIIRLLQPYITFKKPKSRVDLAGHSYDGPYCGLNIYRNIKYDWGPLFDRIIFPRAPTLPGWSRIGDRPAPYTNETNLEIISLEEYVHFIQCIFPRIVQEELRHYKKKLKCEEYKQDILDDQRNSIPRFKLPMFIDITDFEEECNQYIEELNQSNKEELKLLKGQNKMELEEIPKKISYLEKVQEINREKNGSIENVINFIKKLEYINLGTPSKDSAVITIPISSLRSNGALLHK